MEQTIPALDLAVPPCQAHPGLGIGASSQYLTPTATFLQLASVYAESMKHMQVQVTFATGTGSAIQRRFCRAR